MGEVIRASVLVLLLTCSATAGVMTHGSPETPPPPPPSTQSIQEPTTEDQETSTSDEVETSLLIRVALNLLALL